MTRTAGRPALTVTGSGRNVGWAIRNNTSANAAVRDAEYPAPTMYFGARLNTMWWEPTQTGLDGGTLEDTPTKEDTMSYCPACQTTGTPHTPASLECRMVADDRDLSRADDA